MRAHIYELGALCAYGGAVALLYRAVGFLAERDYVATVLCAGIGLAVGRLAGDLLRFAMWRGWLEEGERETDTPEGNP